MSHKMVAQSISNRTKSYPLDAKLIKYMHEKSQLQQKKEKINAAGKKKLSKEDREKLEGIETRLTSLKNDKTRILHKIIFPSMANLCFFFEAVAQSPQLQENFASDIIQLLGIRRNSPSEDNYAFMFRRLIWSIFFPSEPRENDFTLKLANQLQQIIYVKMKRPLYEFFKENSEPKNMVLLDIERVKAWTELISQTVNDEYTFDIQFKEKYGKTEEERVEYFNEYAAKNQPAR